MKPNAIEHAFLEKEAAIALLMVTVGWNCSAKVREFMKTDVRLP